MAEFPCDSLGCPLWNICLFHVSSAAVTGLYFPQNEYTETVYVGQPAGSPVLQVHSMLDSSSERPHFYLCRTVHPAHSSWFHMDVHTGVLSLNKTLEESDFALSK